MKYCLAGDSLPTGQVILLIVPLMFKLVLEEEQQLLSFHLKSHEVHGSVGKNEEMTYMREYEISRL